ncbi:F-actin-monooxygenase MICAL2 isoform X1 [Tachysurus fulvidraco]|uniref:F-actin-monooxygenase MICAL2 isoform X1 n=1 Tax=Tachysurus fulvidraco TaxID=1234273 RepID=UPI001FEE207A|nr:F-actin-monooxygenase MICAL2 isoform X1 [Tachysurus fulvidraco]XP_047665860.1 F-actin-monooxygenase MICAL2 isoform X1 [Tachysurus fulvidraco]
MGEMEEDKSRAGRMFETFVQATTCKSTLQAFNILCTYLELDPLEYDSFYSSLKSRLTCWKAKALWSKLDKRAAHKEYKKVPACIGTKCLIIGGGPCGLRTAIELAFLGAKVVVIEKRDTFSRNNVLHLWPFTIHDLRGLGAKKFYGKFCAGAIDHISIRQLQLMLLKIALLLGVEFHVNVEFVKLLEPPEDQENEGPGWKAEIRPSDHPVADFDFDVVVGADGRRNTLEGFRRKEFRGKLAIAITANFINRNTTAEAKVEEISGVAFIFNQKFFQDLKQETGIDLENIVYYKDNTHYFVMTAKKQSLLDKGVIIHDYIDTEALLSSDNVNQEALLCYAREAADYATHYQLPTLEYAMNHLDQPDVAMFDFTCMYASENAALVRERFGHQLLVALVGDSLLEPFWPMGTGCARGFLAAFDTAWMVKSWAQGRGPLEVLAERESLYRLLPQTTPENIAKNFDQYTIDPGTRYPNLNSNCVRPHQVRNYYMCGELKSCSLERAATIRRPVNLARRESEIRPSRLLTWCQKQTEGYRGVTVTDLNSSWTSGLAFCALIHRFRAHLIDYDSLNEEDSVKNVQLAFDTAEKEFGIKPFTTGKELASGQEPDKNSMVTYLSKFYELFRGTPLPSSDSRRETGGNNKEFTERASQPVCRSMSFTLPRKRIPKDDKKVEDNDSFNKRRRRTVCNFLEQVNNLSSQNTAPEKQEIKENKVKFMASQLLARFEESTPSCTLRRQLTASALRPPGPPSHDLTELPLSIKPRKKNPPPPPPKTQLQPSDPLLPFPFNISRHDCQNLTHTVHASQSHSHSKPSDTHMKPTSQSEIPEADHAASCHSAILTMRAMLQRLQRVEEKINQRKAQTENTREFRRKSIKEKANHLSSLFSGSNVEPPQLSSNRSACEKETEMPQWKGNKNIKTFKKRTVGKVSLVVEARAERLLTLYENDHRPTDTCITSPGSLRREFPQSSGDVCYACKKRVYVVERLSAEGLFFHRECFRCDTCSAPLCQGAQAFDSEQGKLYCKLHFSQRKCAIKPSRILEPQMPSESTTRRSASPSSAESDISSTPSAGTLSSVLRRSLLWPLHVSRAVCATPRRVRNWLGEKAQTLGRHLRENAHDYTILYELLSVGLPLLVVLYEILLQMHAETGPLNLQLLQQWLEQHLGRGFLT